MLNVLKLVFSYIFYFKSNSVLFLYCFKFLEKFDCLTENQNDFGIFAICLVGIVSKAGILFRKSDESG